jgi:hypothetical protein
MKLKELDINVQGNFSDMRNRDEYKFISKNCIGGMMHYNCVRRKANNKKFTINITLCGTSLIINDSRDIKHNNRFIGGVKEVEGGFIPCSSLTNYHNNRKYKTFDDAKRALINKKYSEKEKRCFGYLAQQKFYYSENYLKDLSLEEVAIKINGFIGNMKLAIKVVKKFLRSDIIGYYSQGGYVLSNGQKVVY